MQTATRSFKKATKREFELMTVQERKEYLNRFHNFIYDTFENNNLKESADQTQIRGQK